MKNGTTEKLILARKDFHRYLAEFPNVKGTAIGYRRKSNVITNQPGITVYVKRKIPLANLEAASLIPRSLGYHGKTISIDVYPVGDLERQVGQPPWYCRDEGKSQGTVSTLCKSVDGSVFGLTCSHCIGGLDGDPSTADEVSLWDSGTESYYPVGASNLYSYTSGLGLPTNFGFSDWALFSIERDIRLVTRANSAKIMLFGNDAIGTKVTAITAHGVLEGVVEHRFIQLHKLFADLLVRIDRGAAFRGDSGAMWRDDKGRAVGIHAIGTRSPTGSQLSLGMSALRVNSDLAETGISMLDI